MTTESPVWADLTYPLNDRTPVFPGQPGFTYEVHGRIDDPEIPLFFGGFAMMEHCGTHMDAPAHAVADGRTVDQIPLAGLHGPGVVIDLAEQCGGDADFDVTADHIEEFEGQHGRIEAGSIVIVRTGWGQFWSTPGGYVVVREDGWHWPGVSGEAAALLVRRGAIGVGLDTVGLDGGHVAMTLAAHRAVLGSGAFILENLAGLDGLPTHLDEVWALPIKVEGGSGGPTRVVARMGTR